MEQAMNYSFLYLDESDLKSLKQEVKKCHCQRLSKKKKQQNLANFSDMWVKSHLT